MHPGSPVFLETYPLQSKGGRAQILAHAEYKQHHERLFRVNPTPARVENASSKLSWAVLLLFIYGKPSLKCFHHNEAWLSMTFNVFELVLGNHTWGFDSYFDARALSIASFWSIMQNSGPNLRLRFRFLSSTWQKDGWVSPAIRQCSSSFVWASPARGVLLPPPTGCGSGLHATNQRQVLLIDCQKNGYVAIEQRRRIPWTRTPMSIAWPPPIWLVKQAAGWLPYWRYFQGIPTWKSRGCAFLLLPSSSDKKRLRRGRGLRVPEASFDKHASTSARMLPLETSWTSWRLGQTEGVRNYKVFSNHFSIKAHGMNPNPA